MRSSREDWLKIRTEEQPPDAVPARPSCTYSLSLRFFGIERHSARKPGTYWYLDPAVP